MKRGLAFIRAGDRLLPVAGVRYVDCSKLTNHKIVVEHGEGTFILVGADAIDAVMLLKPSAFEGRRLRWVKHAWSAHNMLGHPLMQVLAWLGRPRLGVWVHEVTTPRPQR